MRAILFCLSVTILASLLPAEDKATQIEALMREAYKIGVFNGNVLVSAKDRIIYQASLGYADASKAVRFPLKPCDLSYAYELLADSYVQKGSKALALVYFRKSVETDPANKNARGKLDGMSSK